MSTVPPPYQALVDDAAIFPPGNAPLPEAVTAHRRHREQWYAGLLGPFVVSDPVLPELEDVGFPVSLVVTGGAGAVEPAVSWATRDAGLEVRSLEVAVRDDDTGALAHNAQRLVTAVDRVVGPAAEQLAEEVAVYVELPRLRGRQPSASWLAAADQLAVADLRVKLRTGGVEAAAFPPSAEIATCIAAALDRELRFKCTAGLHRAVRHRDPETGFEHHGFLNVLLATRASLDGASLEEVADLLDEADPSAVTKLLAEAGDQALASARTWFGSFGSCSVLEPLEDLVDLGLVSR